MTSATNVGVKASLKRYQRWKASSAASTLLVEYWPLVAEKAGGPKRPDCPL